MFAMPAAAHHSSAPHFDRSSSLEITGNVTELKFVNPHAYLYLDVIENGTAVNWRCELSAATILKRRGWTADMFKGGEEVTVQGSPAWREDHVCLLSSMSINGGAEISRNAELGESTAKVNVAAAEPRGTHLPNGQPNISGNWLTKSFGRNALGTQPRYVANAAGEIEMADYDMRFDDPVLKCHFMNIMKAWNHDSNVNKIDQTDTAVILTYGFMDAVRTIHLDQDSHPKDLQLSMTGHSIGRWEGEKLIVDTVGFEAGVLDHGTGVKHSADMQVRETFFIDPDTGYLAREYTATDTLLAQDVYGLDYMALSDEVYEPYGCTELSGENNIRPEGVDVSLLPGVSRDPMGPGATSREAIQNASQNSSATVQAETANKPMLARILAIILALIVLVGITYGVKRKKG